MNYQHQSYQHCRVIKEVRLNLLVTLNRNKLRKNEAHLSNLPKLEGTILAHVDLAKSLNYVVGRLVKMAVGKGLSGEIYDVAGVRLSAVSVIRYQDRLDLVLIELTEESKSAGVFTKNFLCCPVVVAKSHLASNDPRVLIINTGNANAGTGDIGLQDLQCCQIVAECKGLDPGGNPVFYGRDW